jgi:Multiubiquitin
MAANSDGANNSEHDQEGRQDSGQGRGGDGPVLQIFVNRRKFDESHGVQPSMTGRQIAALVDVPAEIAVVRRERGENYEEIGVDQRVEVKRGDHFLVTRKTVEGGYVA